jgi:type III restriction enzyme
VEKEVPVQPIEKPILCNPYEEPKDHWVYDRQTGEAKHGYSRRPAGYWYKTEKVGSRQMRLFTEEERDDLPLVNLLREDVGRWRDADHRGASQVSKELMRYWFKENRVRRLFFCQREAVETLIYLCEVRIPARSSRTLFKEFKLSDENLRRLLHGEHANLGLVKSDYLPTLIDRPFDSDLLPLVRLGCKMATGSGKTVVMAMLITWAFCNRGVNPASKEYPNGVLVCCPNLTIKERLQVLRPENPENYYVEFDLVPPKYRPLLNAGRVLVTNWHAFAPESEHKDGDSIYAVVDKGIEPAEAFARRVLGDLYDRMPIMVLNDEGHHCWRPAPTENDVNGDNNETLEEEKQEATVWIEGLDKINNARTLGQRVPGITSCIDLSATPFYIKGSGCPEGRPFPWLVSDFGLVDAIESGIVKIPRLPVSDVTGRPEPKYFRLWRAINDGLQPGERLPGRRAGRPKPEVVYREAQGALTQIAGQWVERFKYFEQATPGQETIPPVLIIVCDNTDIASLFHQKISGEREEEIVTEEDVAEVATESEEGTKTKGKKGASKKATRTIYEKGDLFPEYFSNAPGLKRTIRIDSKLLAEAESEDPSKSRKEAGEALRKVVSTVGKTGQPGEHVRCVVSVGMLNEGWDANNVTHVLGIRAFDSQLLCEQVVGRGLRRMDYTPDPSTGRLTEEYVDVYGIPFSVIPFKGRPSKKSEADDRPKNHVRALLERAAMEIRFPVVEGYAFALKRNLIRCDIDSMEPLVLEPNQEPTATFVKPMVGYQEGVPSQITPFAFIEQNRQAYYAENHLQTIVFEIARGVIIQLTGGNGFKPNKRQRVLRLCSRHQLFPQVYRFVQEYVNRKVDFHGCDPRELGLQKYVLRIVERVRDAIEPDDAEGEPPLMPVLNRYKAMGTTSEVDFKTTRSCRATGKSHVNQVVLDTDTWEASATFRLEQSNCVEFYVRNDHLGLVIPYEFEGVDHGYEPDFLVRLRNGITVILEIKGYEDEKTRAKHAAAKRWESAVNNWGNLGTWKFHPCRDPQLLGKELEYLACREARG